MTTAQIASVAVKAIKKNPRNPRRFFNEERLDLLRTSIQEEGVLVPLIAYRDPEDADSYVLMDGERRWRCSIDLGLETVPTHLIEPPSPLDNLLRMFNIHFTRDDWPLISVALSLKDVIEMSGEDRETRLADMTGLTRATIRRAKRLLTMPEAELEKISAEAHWDRAIQVHREDLYLEIADAESVLRNAFPEINEEFPREELIRRFAEKREEGHLDAVTDFRKVGKFVKAVENDFVGRQVGVEAAREFVLQVEVSPNDLYEQTAARAYAQLELSRKAELLLAQLDDWIRSGDAAEDSFRAVLEQLAEAIQRALAGIE